MEYFYDSYGNGKLLCFWFVFLDWSFQLLWMRQRCSSCRTVNLIKSLFISYIDFFSISPCSVFSCPEIRCLWRSTSSFIAQHSCACLRWFYGCVKLVVSLLGALLPIPHQEWTEAEVWGFWFVLHRTGPAAPSRAEC